MFTLRVGVSAWCTVGTSVMWLWGAHGVVVREFFKGLDCSLGACEPIHYVCVSLNTMIV